MRLAKGSPAQAMRRRLLTLTIAVTAVFTTMSAHAKNLGLAAGLGGLFEQRSAQASSEDRGKAPQKPRGPVELKVVILLTQEKTAAKRISIYSLSNYIKSIQGVVADQFSDEPDDVLDLMINCELLPDKSKFRDSYAPEADQDDLQIVYDNLKKLVIPIRKGSVRFQAVFTCSRRKWRNIAVHALTVFS